MDGVRYKMRAKVWRYPGMASPSAKAMEGQGAWYFVTLPKKESREISARFDLMKRGWGSLQVLVTVGETTWKTSIFPDKRSGAYLLPLKVEVRKKEEIRSGETIAFSIEIRA